MNITKKFLQDKHACDEAVTLFVAEKRKSWTPVALLDELIKRDKLDWANWFVCRAFNRKHRIYYAIFAAEQVLEIFEKKYPKDNRPRLAIAAAKLVLRRDTSANRAAAWAAGDAAWAEMQKIILDYGISLLEASNE